MKIKFRRPQVRQGPLFMAAENSKKLRAKLKSVSNEIADQARADMNTNGDYYEADVTFDLIPSPVRERTIGVVALWARNAQRYEEQYQTIQRAGESYRG